MPVLTDEADGEDPSSEEPGDEGEPEPTEAATTAPSPTSAPVVRWDELGFSVEGRPLSVAVLGYEDGAPVVLVGSIQGDQTNTRDLLDMLISDLTDDLSVIPEGVAFHVIPSINPDGNAAGTRRNAHNVDLNRNWNTYDWRRDAEQPGGVVGGSGGDYPHSEPETQSLAEYLRALKNERPDTQLVLWHSSQRLSSGGQVYPAIDEGGIHRPSLSLAQRYADSTGYSIEDTWDPYSTSGELIVWCSEEGMPAIDIVIPRSVSGSDRGLRNLTLGALIDMVGSP
jgi:hypothetical protein